jgi:hypothetical protein
MKNTPNFFFNVIIIVISLSSCGPADPTNKTNYYLEGAESSPYYFKKDGTVETWDQGKEYWDKSCLSNGNWHVEGDIVIIENISNGNCPEMTERNGRFKLSGESLVRQ